VRRLPASRFDGIRLAGHEASGSKFGISVVASAPDRRYTSSVVAAVESTLERVRSLAIPATLRNVSSA
jgi:hypothetical protein